jgi:hypothetical protein
MAIVLFVTPQEIAQGTILDGNVDVDKYLFCIEQVMEEKLQTILGTELYEKIYNDIDNDVALTGLYLELFVKFIKPITKFESVAEFISISPYSVSNYGTVKSTGDNITVVDDKEVQRLSDTYHSKAQTYITRFSKWICLNKLEEYKSMQDGVDASKNVNVNSGWFLR